jgi:hypothetical protein
MAGVQAATFEFDYRPAQSDLPDNLAEHLALDQTYLQVDSPLSSGEQDKLLEAGIDKTTVQKLVDDLEDRETLDTLYNRWLVEEPVSRKIPPEELPLDLQQAVSFREGKDPGWFIRYHGLMTEDEGRALQGCFTEASDKEAIERLHARSVRGVYAGLSFEEPISVQVSLDQLPEEYRYLVKLVDLEPDRIRYRGILCREQADVLRDLFATAEGREAIERLYERSERQGLHGPELKIIARRGASAPSSLWPLTATTLESPGE